MVQPLAQLCDGSSDTVSRPSTSAVTTRRTAAGRRAAGTSADASAAVASEGTEQQQDGLRPAYYQLYCDPVSYADALKSFLAQQAAESTSQRTSWGASMLGVFRAVARGDVWGVGFFCRQ
jgi:hypothetical protein